MSHSNLPQAKELNSELHRLIHSQPRSAVFLSQPLQHIKVVKPRHQSTHSPRRSRSRNPLVLLCCVTTTVILSVYFIVFLEIDGLNIFHLLLTTQSPDTQQQHDIFREHASSSQLLEIIQSPPSTTASASTTTATSHPTHSNAQAQAQTTHDHPQPVPNMMANSSQPLHMHGDGFFEMFEHIHSTPFDTLSPELQTRHLHEAFRFKFFERLQTKQQKGDIKNPSDGYMFALLNEIYRAYDAGVNFVQIGACDGVWEQSNDDMQRVLMRNKRWHGAMLEPVPLLFQKLTKLIRQRIPGWKDRIVLINAALSDHDGNQTFYVVNEHFRQELPKESHALKFQIGSFLRSHLTKHLQVKRDKGQLKYIVDHYIDAIQVTTMSAPTVLRMYRESDVIERDGSIDVLSIDVEGYDHVVLKSFLVHSAIRPLIVTYEHLHLQEKERAACIELLHEYGYIDLLGGWNTVGIRIANL